MIDSVLSQIGVSRVISVDDKNKPFPDIADILGHLQSLNAGELEPMLAPFPGLFARDAEILGRHLREFWDEQGEASKRTFLERIALKGGATGAQVAADAAAVRSLPILFQTWDFRAMSLPQWRMAAKNVIAECETQKTMILFDEDLSDQGGSQDEGLTLIKETLASTDEEHVICCLLSHNYHMPTIHDDWRRVCKENGFPEHQVIIIPKDLLIDNPCDFAGLIKLASISKYYRDLKDNIQKVFTKSLKVATEKIQLLNIYDLDQIVFVSSDHEGVWEPDTMIRLLGIFHNRETRTQAMQDDGLRSASEEIRRISGVSTPMSTPPSAALFNIQHLENYEDGGPLNELHRPTDLGDIYARVGGRKYILILPPCDIMVRTKGGCRGSDSDLIKEGILAEIVDALPKGGLAWELEHFVHGQSMFVDFKKAFSAKLFYLDLCVFNADGSAKFKIQDSPAKLLIPAWMKRHEFVAKQLLNIIESYRHINPTGPQKDRINKLLTRADSEMTLVGDIKPDEGSIVMNFRRIARLLTPRSTALLKAYGEFLNRDAFDHSFI